ncbi:glyoxalase [Pedobacter sp. PAMC26386]|nr:glyoxalase [Pedobacter sp. PAMC26386]
MIEYNHDNLISAIFITFSGNCKKALTFYQICFGGLVQFETFEKKIEGYAETPVITGSLVSDRIIIYGSDLVQDEGRKLGNYISIFLQCKNTYDRKELMEKLDFEKKAFFVNDCDDQKLIEVTDAFDVRWILGI